MGPVIKWEIFPPVDCSIVAMASRSPRGYLYPNMPLCRLVATFLDLRFSGGTADRFRASICGPDPDFPSTAHCIWISGVGSKGVEDFVLQGPHKGNQFQTSRIRISREAIAVKTLRALTGVLQRIRE